MPTREGELAKRDEFLSRPRSLGCLDVGTAGAPYQDRLEDDGRTLIYEGHDAPQASGGPDPKTIDQPFATPSGNPNENGHFQYAARDYKAGKAAPRLVRVHEKLRKGAWSYNGGFLLRNAWTESDGRRQVFKFKLTLAPEAEPTLVRDADFLHRRLIPTEVKLKVWKRDRGQCVKCGATNGLHFDHVLPYSRGGASVTVENIQLLCARHNLEKSDRIE